MIRIYGVVFKEGGKLYYFKSEDLFCPINVTVIVETEKGIQFGQVVTHIDNSDNKIDVTHIRDIIRLSTKKDYDQQLRNISDANNALIKAKDFAKELKLDMSIIDATFTFDRKQLLFNFIADDRVDFRELAKKLANVYRTRIELRQIGARDKAKEVSGLGPCGLELCCHAFLNHIDSISMAMAKNQNLSLNPAKINGLCGRLLCCLTYEDDEYSRCQKDLPYVGETVKHEGKTARVVSVDILRRKYKIDFDGEIVEVILEEKCGSCSK